MVNDELNMIEKWVKKGVKIEYKWRYLFTFESDW